MTRQQDAVGLAIFDEQLRTFYPPRLKASYLREILKVLQQTEPSNSTHTQVALRNVLERIKRRGLVIVISDFLDEPKEVITSLKLLRNAGHEVIAFQVLDPVERTLALTASDATIYDLESGEFMKTQPYQLQETYKAAVEAYLEELRTSLAAERIDHVVLETTTPFDRALTEYFYRRQMIG